MSKNIDQIYTANPITTNASTDLLYIGQSPYGSGDDAAITYEDFSAQFGGVTPAQIQGAVFLEGTDSGIADAYVVTLDPSASFTEGNGTVVSFTPNYANATTSPTLAVNGNPGLPIYLPNNTPVSPNDIQPSNVATYCIYSNGIWMLMNPIVSYVSAVQAQQSAFNYGTDTGSADSYVVNLSPAIESLTDGLFVTFQPLNNNLTTSPYITINAIGPTQIFSYAQGGILPGDISQYFDCVLFYSVTYGGFICLNPRNSISTWSTDQQNINIHAVDSGSTNAYAWTTTLNEFNQADGSFVILTALNSTNTGASTLNVANNGNESILLPNFSSLSGGELIGGNTYFFLYSVPTASWILLNSSLSAGATAQEIQQSAFNTGTDTGSANTYAVDLSPAVTSLTNGLLVSFRAANTNNSSSTLAINSLSPSPILTPDGSMLIGGEIQGGSTYLLEYGANGNFILLNSSLTASSNLVQINSYSYGIDSGVADAYVVNISPAPNSTYDGTLLIFSPTHDNLTTTPTVTVPNAWTLANIKLSNGPVQAGDLSTAMIAVCYWSSSANAFILTTPAVS